MGKRIVVSVDQSLGLLRAAPYLIGWCCNHPNAGLGGATGRSQVGLWALVHQALAWAKPEVRSAVYDQCVYFLDEYLGPYASYYHWAYRYLCAGGNRFAPERIFTPPGCFYFPGTQQPVTSARLEQHLLQPAIVQQWTACKDKGEGGRMPEIRIAGNATDPLLVQIRDAMAAYDRLVQSAAQRLQILGVGPGGMIEHDVNAGGHFGFVEAGAADPQTTTMLVRLASSTIKANAPDFQLRNDDGDVTLEPAHHAITQGISTILNSGELLVLAWGSKKALPVERMLLGTPGTMNPAAWAQTKDNVTIFLDRDAFGGLDAAALEARGWAVEFPDGK